MTDQQKVILEIMKWFHTFCETHQLSYYIMGGTLLGAVRHQGFIPWDDDADIGMPRSDYERFLELTKNVSRPYTVESPKYCHSDYQWPFAKIYDPKTTLIENGETICVRGVWVDVFPIDATLNGFSRVAKYVITRSLIKVLAIKKLHYSHKRKFWKKCVLVLCHSILRNVSTVKLIGLIDHYSANSDFSRSKYIADIVWGAGWLCHTPKYFWGTPKLYKFEDTYFFGLTEDDKYLTQLYGDYRKLPPISKRVKHDCLYIDLEHGWDSDETKACLMKIAKG